MFLGVQGHAGAEGGACMAPSRPVAGQELEGLLAGDRVEEVRGTGYITIVIVPDSAHSRPRAKELDCRRCFGEPNHCQMSVQVASIESNYENTFL